MHTKHEKELLTAHYPKRNKHVSVSVLPVMFDGDFGRYFQISEHRCGEILRVFSPAVEGGLVCQSPFKVPTNIYGNVVVL